MTKATAVVVVSILVAITALIVWLRYEFGSISAVTGLLLLFGINRSKKAPDAEHPLGYGKELYFWSLVVAVLIFAIGGGMSFYEGIAHLQHPEEIGRVGLLMLKSLINDGARGIPPIFRQIQVEGSWSDGDSAPPRR